MLLAQGSSLSIEPEVTCKDCKDCRKRQFSRKCKNFMCERCRDSRQTFALPASPRKCSQVVGLVAFICIESVAECRGMFNCAPPGYVHSYRFFAFVSFSSILVTGAIFAARMLGVSGRVPIPAKYHPFAVSSPRGTAC
ncbi:hypothetical protein HPB48_005235 [Haemaphysalis longicornis]|uniref:Uncharacterized protein n=1 Tax=Haemaphysalis longicornis TaxID=44386 RepID=A0A9J6FEB8_HAELO|nr:hypothetical protein HPB48_005235 [Haemaphysalis longicornis]